LDRLPSPTATDKEINLTTMYIFSSFIYKLTVRTSSHYIAQKKRRREKTKQKKQKKKKKKNRTSRHQNTSTKKSSLPLSSSSSSNHHLAIEGSRLLVSSVCVYRGAWAKRRRSNGKALGGSSGGQTLLSATDRCACRAGSLQPCMQALR
jgi:hypothetical protein